MNDHNDFLDAAASVLRYESAISRPAMSSGARSHPFNPWWEMVEIVVVGPTGGARVRPAGGHDSRGPEEIRWWPLDSLVVPCPPRTQTRQHGAGRRR